VALSQKNPSQKKGGGVVQDVEPEFKPQYCKKKKKLEWLERTFAYLLVIHSSPGEKRKGYTVRLRSQVGQK
jgi:hypothetical protein